MKVKKSRIIIIYFLLIALLTYKFPFSAYLKLVSICGISLFLLKSHFSAKINSKNIYVFCLVTFAAWGSLSYLWAAYPGGVREQIFNMLNAILLNVGIVVFITSRNEDFDDVLKWLFPVMFIYLIEAIIVGSFNWDGRFSPTGATNQFGISTSYVYLFTLYSARKKKIPLKGAYVLVAIAAVLTILSGSRKAFANLVLFSGMLFLFENYNKNTVKNIAKVIVAIAMSAIVVVLLLKVNVLYDAVGRRIETLFAYYSGDVRQDLSALRRAFMKADAIALFYKNPIIGAGLNNFKFIAGHGTYAHSDIYEILCCLGIVGEALYFIPFMICLFFSFLQWKRNMPNAVVIFAVFLSMLINEFSNVSYIYCNLHAFFGIAAGLLFVNNQRNKKTRRLSTQESVGNHKLKQKSFAQ